VSSNDPLRPSRRRFLVGLGGSTAALAGPLALGGAAAGAAAAVGGGGAAAAGPTVTLNLADIQGNVLAGFNKDHQAFVAVVFPKPVPARRWLAAIRPQVATAAEVGAFNTAFRAVAARTGSEAATPTATWLNVAFTSVGMRYLGISSTDLGLFPQDFLGGMASRAAHLGDVGPNAPSLWPLPFRTRVHALVLLAADRSTDLDAAIAAQRTLATQQGVTVAWVQRGDSRVDKPGHEHFGFRDGLSQPAVRGFTTPSDPTRPDVGQPGQDMIWPGEFVIGQPTQAGVGQPITAAGPPSVGGPAWTTNGSYLVFRRLTQDVAGFRESVAQMAATQGISTDLMGAKLVGRYRSGAALEQSGNQATDPGIADPSLVDPSKVNDFEFAADNGSVVPLAAHIRKTYPRDAPTRDGGEADTQRHRIIRRGIPFGTPLPDSVPSTDPTARPPYPNDRGLLFLCYQSSIARQFEFIQNRWVNNPNFPSADAGHDPVISQVDGTRTFTMPGGRPDHIALMQRFVTTTGGDYFFCPSISALGVLVSLTSTTVTPAPKPPPTTTTTTTRPPTTTTTRATTTTTTARPATQQPSGSGSPGPGTTRPRP